MMYELTVNCSKDNLKAIREFVERHLYSNINMPQKQIGMIVLAVDEICSNLIIHSNSCDENKEIHLTMNLQESLDEILFEIYDNGLPFDYSQYKEPEIANLIKQRQKGSLGLMLVRKIMDKIEFEQEQCYNVCRLYKKLENFNIAI